MDGYWWGVLTPFAIILGILLLYLTGNLFGWMILIVRDHKPNDKEKADGR